MITKVREDFAALAAGVAVFLASGLITGSTAVWISTAVGAVTATLAAFTVKQGKRTARARGALVLDDDTPLTASAIANPPVARPAVTRPACRCEKPKPGAKPQR